MTNAALGTVRVEERRHALWIVLDRPNALNAMDDAMVRSLDEALTAIGDDSRPIVFIGAGRAFCTGGDLKFFLTILDDFAGLRAYFERAAGVLLRIARHPAATIAAVNGLALAGGLELICVCDLAVAARSARVGDGHLNYGVIPGGGNSALVPALAGDRAGRWLLLSGELVAAEEALRLGLVNAVVDDGDLRAEAQRMADILAAKPRAAVRQLKRLIARDIEGVLDRERMVLLEHLATPEARATLESFAARNNDRRY
jgi:enoyl-CoA hydratase/carnithine racemase